MNSEWINCEIADLGDVVGGATPSTKKIEYYNGEIPWITPKDLSDHKSRFISRGERNITLEGLRSCSTQILPKNTVLFSSRAPIGYVAIAANDLCTNQGFKSVIPNDKTDFMFLFYLLKYNKDAIENMASGTTFKEVSGAAMRKIVVRVPDLETQKKIAKVLSALDDKIELNNQINKNLEEQANALFDNMFPNISQGNKIVGDYIVPKRGKSLLSKDAVLGDVPVVAGGLEPSTYHNESNTTAPVITISASGANAGYVSLWHIPVWSSDSSYIDSKMSDSVYFWYVLLKKRQNEIYDLQTGSAQPHIYPQHIAELPLSELSLESISLFNIRVTSLFAQIANNKAENAILHKTRDALLPKLMSGEIDVDNVEI